MMIVIDAPHFYAGCCLDSGRVTRAAPILAYMRGWELTRVLAYAKRKGWHAIEVRA